MSSSNGASPMTSTRFAGDLKLPLSNDPEFRYLEAFMRDSRMGNAACKDLNQLSRDVIVLERRKNRWNEKPWDIGQQAWELNTGADGYAIIANYLDFDFIRSIMDGFNIDARAFKSHIDGCEQHYKGSWAQSSMTLPPYLHTEQHQARHVSFDFRRPYFIGDDLDLSKFEASRRQRCSLLRSHHSAKSANMIFEHERCTIAWSPPHEQGPKHLILALCDPGIGDVRGDNMVREIAASIILISDDRRFDGSMAGGLNGVFSSILSKWNWVLFYADIQISALEDQVEHDFWDKPRNPVEILHEAQRVSRNLTRYRNQVTTLEVGLEFLTAGDIEPGVVMTLQELQSRFETLIRRTDKAVPALLASIAINEGIKASSLTAVALWFAPLSLSISIVSIDGNSKLGGTKYWVWACIAIPLLVLAISVVHSSDGFIQWVGQRKRGRGFIPIFKA